MWCLKLVFFCFLTNPEKISFVNLQKMYIQLPPSEVLTFRRQFSAVFMIYKKNKKIWRNLLLTLKFHYYTSLQALRAWILELEMSVHRNRFFGQTDADRWKHRRRCSNSSLDMYLATNFCGLLRKPDLYLNTILIHKI